MAKDLQSLVGSGSARELQEKLENWQQNYDTNSSGENLTQCCEILELNTAIQKQLFSILNETSQGEKCAAKIKSCLLPSLCCTTSTSDNQDSTGGELQLRDLSGNSKCQLQDLEDKITETCVQINKMEKDLKASRAEQCSLRKLQQLDECEQKIDQLRDEISMLDCQKSIIQERLGRSCSPPCCLKNCCPAPCRGRRCCPAPCRGKKCCPAPCLPKCCPDPCCDPCLPKCCPDPCCDPCLPKCCPDPCCDPCLPKCCPDPCCDPCLPKCCPDPCCDPCLPKCCPAPCLPKCCPDPCCDPCCPAPCLPKCCPDPCCDPCCPAPCPPKCCPAPCLPKCCPDPCCPDPCCDPCCPAPCLPKCCPAPCLPKCCPDPCCDPCLKKCCIDPCLTKCWPAPCPAKCCADPCLPKCCPPCLPKCCPGPCLPQCCTLPCLPSKYCPALPCPVTPCRALCVRPCSPPRPRRCGASYRAYLISRYNFLYAKERLDAENILRPFVCDMETVQRIIYVAAVESFRAAKMAFWRVKISVKDTFAICHKAGPASLEAAVLDYIACHKDLYDVCASVHEVVCALNKNPKLPCPGEVDYLVISCFIRELCCLAFSMQTLIPALDIAFGIDGEFFNRGMYYRSFDSDFTAPFVAYHVWPALIEDGTVIVKGEVVTKKVLSVPRSRSLSTVRVRRRC